EPVFSAIRNRFVCGYKNIKQESYVGNSVVHGTDSPAAVTTNGAGPHNMQLFIMSEDGTVLHCLPGYWDANDLASELQLGEKLNAIWQDSSITLEQKNAMFKKMQLEHLASHSTQTQERSHLQGFDALHIAHNMGELKDCVKDAPMLLAANIKSTPTTTKTTEGPHVPMEAFKTTDEIMHQRMSERPFRSYEKFDTVAFTNYGSNFYDKQENESETARYRPELKKAQLNVITRSTEKAPPAACAKAKEPTEREAFDNFFREGKYEQSLTIANAMVRRMPTKAEGYELRSSVEFALRQYKQALNDTTRAKWLGSRNPQIFLREKQCRQMLGYKLASL
ncbi:MAG: hypothetical protein K2X81_14505, partial [Candidatus Obscuribacterales bacterium]|nr:hypothetical protein [Candidatus Obscuribacterales bacterium]